MLVRVCYGFSSTDLAYHATALTPYATTHLTDRLLCVLTSILLCCTTAYSPVLTYYMMLWYGPRSGASEFGLRHTPMLLRLDVPSIRYVAIHLTTDASVLSYYMVLRVLVCMLLLIAYGMVLGVELASSGYSSPAHHSSVARKPSKLVGGSLSLS
eukprot:871232-Rhodomonas_salina.1